MTEERVRVIGGGFAGSEAAIALSNLGVPVLLIERRPDEKLFHFNNSGNFAYPVCSNSFKSVQMQNGHGLLKAELSVMRSSLLKHARKSRVKAGKALAVDRDEFSLLVTRDISNRKNIVVERRVADEDDLKGRAIIATGPFTSENILECIKNLAGQKHYSFIDSVSPILLAESVNMEKCFTASRYNEGNDYINCPMTKDEFNVFYDELLKAERSGYDETDKEEFFSGCMPFEEVARYGRRALVFGIMKPVGFDKKYYAVVQLRRENREGTMLNMVGFQTRLKWGEQERIVRMIPGLEKAEILRYGVMHKNPYVDSPSVLNENLEFKNRKNLYLAGQLTGSEGYMEATLTGIYVALSVFSKIKKREMTLPPETTMSGSLLRYLLKSEKKINPMNANFGLLKDYSKKNKLFYAKRALKDIWEWYNERTL
ncbi:MAG: methylenetetrahydrofolate--tRNA-(uracil(54)-C(5))-methyltransferase (FADH(2)-oxidizing) TrmFO [bacterium]|nr:methylenetetrahydrofolate--tRNA-(uracil(54)-C(5))-methyltransferase (FADH(2)-oxidizing) TrmFO [bacterium]